MKIFSTADEAFKKCKKGKEVRKVGKNKYIVVTKEKRDKDWWLEEEINMYEEEEGEEMSK